MGGGDPVRVVRGDGVESGKRPRQLARRSRRADLGTERGEAGERAAGVDGGAQHDDLPRQRCVGDLEGDGLVVRARLGVELVLDGDVDRRARQADLLGGGKQLGAAGCVAEDVAEAEVVDQCRAVLDLAVDADERRLAERLDLVVEQLDGRRSDQRADVLGGVVEAVEQVMRRSRAGTDSR